MNALKALAIIGGFIALAFIVIATYAALVVSSYWDDLEEQPKGEDE